MINNNRLIEPKTGRAILPEYLDDQQIKSFYPFRSGREAIVALIKLLNLSGESILLPGHLPEGIIAPFLKFACKISYYRLDAFGNADINFLKHLLLNLDKKPRLAVFIHYFGIFRNINDFINSLKPYGIPVLEDLAHTYFLTDSEVGHNGQYVLFSLPKIIGISDGGILICRNNLKLVPSLTNHFSAKFYSWLKQLALQFDSINHLSKFSAIFNITAYKLLMQYYSAPTDMSRRAYYDWLHIDHNQLIKKTRENALLYCKNLECKNIKLDPQLKPDRDVLMGFPIYTKHRDKLESHLLTNGIKPLKFISNWGYLPEHLECEFSETLQFRNEHLLLPVNHRLHTSEIKKVIQIVNTFKP